jgi:asparagine N-glycosylation enzyme membrane subunit Stt3
MSKKVEQTYLAQSATFTSGHVIKESSLNLTCQINLKNGSSFTGNTTMQVSNDLETWIDIPDSEVSLTGITNSNFYDTQTASAYVRVKVTVLTGDGDINIDWLLL